ncbi:hypothetical protein like AT1G63190 [Hibiscus trionum]|uniref:Cystatin domain-containing protein n=1 Tax=Hibiscus trionum TaxID=183268 RepID=A0A9W7GXC6_HIBTR|nr:hypothetical protein like AT1G63190 [Hibiscus trionum]
MSGSFIPYDSDDEGMNKELWSKYEAEVISSRGYDVGEYNCISCGMIIPIDVNYIEELPSYAVMAVDDYNRQNHTNFKFVELLKGNARVVSGVVYYITFKVEDANTGTAETFQTRVWQKIRGRNGEDRFEIQECRIKPTTT